MLHLPGFHHRHASCLQVPANATRLQMSSYHCYQYTYIYDLDSYLSLDAANGIESAAVMWGCEYPATHSSPADTRSAFGFTVLQQN